jgi:hypothetical protein
VTHLSGGSYGGHSTGVTHLSGGYAGTHSAGTGVLHLSGGYAGGHRSGISIGLGLGHGYSSGYGYGHSYGYGGDHDYDDYISHNYGGGYGYGGGHDYGRHGYGYRGGHSYNYWPSWGWSGWGSYGSTVYQNTTYIVSEPVRVYQGDSYSPPPKFKDDDRQDYSPSSSDRPLNDDSSRTDEPRRPDPGPAAFVVPVYDTLDAPEVLPPLGSKRVDAPEEKIIDRIKDKPEPDPASKDDHDSTPHSHGGGH